MAEGHQNEPSIVFSPLPSSVRSFALFQFTLVLTIYSKRSTMQK